MSYLYHVVVMASLYVLLSTSLNLVTGYAGLMSLCHAAFYGTGAYVTAILMVDHGWGFAPCLLFALVFSAFLAAAIAAPTLRLSGDYFVLATLGFQVVLYAVLYNWVGLTRGPYGISAIPAPRVFGAEAGSPAASAALSACVAVLLVGLLFVLQRSPFGRLLRAIRDDELAAAALGKRAMVAKLFAFAIGAGVAGAAGSVYATYMRYIDPTSFTLADSLFVLSVLAIGGAGNVRGPLIGSLVMVGLPEVLRFIDIPAATAASVRQAVLGIALIVLMRVRPQGIGGDYGYD